MKMNTLSAVAGVLACLAAPAWSRAPQPGLSTAPLATPAGVTIQVLAPAAGAAARLSTGGPPQILADAAGLTTYIFEAGAQPGSAACAGECAAQWRPLAAARDAKGPPDWSLVSTTGGGRQWAYRNHPLFSFTGDAKIGDAKGLGVASAQIARFSPAEGLALPLGIHVRELFNAGGQAFVDDEGMPLYFSDDDRPGRPSCISRPCTDNWQVFEAPHLAQSVGDFDVVHREDGVFQWSYRGRPLYHALVDVAAGDARGFDTKWHVALLVRYFTPDNVAVQVNRFGGTNFVTAEGKTIYIHDRANGTQQGHSQRFPMRGNPTIGRMLGTGTCDAACAKMWRPLVAPADAKASAYWDVLARADGSKQWAYRGFALYTHTGDTNPGDMVGNDTYELLVNDDPFKMADVGIKGVGAMVWHTAVP